MTAQMCTRLHLAFFSPILPSYIAKKPSVINNCIINGAENSEMLIILKSIENADKSIHAPKASFNMYFILLHLFFLHNCIHIHLREPHGAICRYSSQCANFDDIEISLSPRNDELTQKLNQNFPSSSKTQIFGPNFSSDLYFDFNKFWAQH